MLGFVRTKALVLELLAAVCLVSGGHEIILSAFDNFKEVSHWQPCTDCWHKRKPKTVWCAKRWHFKKAIIGIWRILIKIFPVPIEKSLLLRALFDIIFHLFVLGLWRKASIWNLNGLFSKLWRIPYRLHGEMYLQWWVVLWYVLNLISVERKCLFIDDNERLYKNMAKNINLIRWWIYYLWSY